LPWSWSNPLVLAHKGGQAIVSHVEGTENRRRGRRGVVGIVESSLCVGLLGDRRQSSLYGCVPERKRKKEKSQVLSSLVACPRALVPRVNPHVCRSRPRPRPRPRRSSPTPSGRRSLDRHCRGLVWEVSKFGGGSDGLGGSWGWGRGLLSPESGI
jgi:hypothetical protein